MDGRRMLAVVPALPEPGAPEGDRRLETARQLVGSRDALADLERRRPGGLEPHLLAGVETPGPPDRLAVALERGRGAHPDGVRAADDLGGVLVEEEEARREQPILEARRDRHPHADPAGSRAQPSQDRVAGGDLRRVGGIERRHRHAVGHLQHAARARELGDEHVRILEIRPPDRQQVVGRDHERPAAVGVEDAAECRRRVEAGEARPVDRAVTSDQRRRVAVSDERVVGDAVHGPARFLGRAEP